MKKLAFCIVASTLFGFNVHAKNDCVKKYPSLKKTIEASEPLKLTETGRTKLTFTVYVARAKEALAVANIQSDEIKKLGCEEEISELESCLTPISWSCETHPPFINRLALEKIEKNKIEELAYESDQIWGATNLFNICCGDFGCTEGGVGIPEVFRSERLATALIQLALEKNYFGGIALKSLELSSQALQTAQCACQMRNAKTIKDVIQNLNSAKAQLAKAGSKAQNVINIYSKIAQNLKEKLPKKECSLPGYD